MQEEINVAEKQLALQQIQIIYLIKISLNFSMKSFHESDCNNSILYLLDTEAITSK